jgi:hypothetical protein
LISLSELGKRLILADLRFVKWCALPAPASGQTALARAAPDFYTASPHNVACGVLRPFPAVNALRNLEIRKGFLRLGAFSRRKMSHKPLLPNYALKPYSNRLAKPE